MSCSTFIYIRETQTTKEQHHLNQPNPTENDHRQSQTQGSQKGEVATQVPPEPEHELAEEQGGSSAPLLITVTVPAEEQKVTAKPERQQANNFKASSLEQSVAGCNSPAGKDARTVDQSVGGGINVSKVHRCYAVGAYTFWSSLETLKSASQAESEACAILGT